MSTSTPKTPTASAISRLLSAAGFERSESSATRIKGWRNHSEGFKVTGVVPGEVRVEHKTGFDRGPDAQSRRAEILQCYAADIEAAGYSVTRDPLWPGLIITRAPVSSSPTTREG